MYQRMGDQRPDARIRVSLTPITGQVKMPFSNDYITLVRVGHIVTACAYITLNGDFEQTGNMSVNETLPDGFRPSGDSRALMRGTDNSGAVSFFFTVTQTAKWCLTAPDIPDDLWVYPAAGSPRSFR